MEVLVSVLSGLNVVQDPLAKRICVGCRWVWALMACSVSIAVCIAQPAPKIVGGKETQSEWPWMAALIQSHVEVPEAGAFCGGSLIHPQWVLTAAHCVEESFGFGFVEPSSLHVVVGSHDLSIPDQGQRIPVLEIIVHPDYNGEVTVKGNDIALLLLAWPVEEAHPISLLEDEALALEGVMATTVGWGVISGNQDAEKPSRLREASYPIVPLDVANEARAYDGSLIPTMLPAGYLKGRISSCYGDSGGPLMVRSPNNGEWVQAGIVSFGKDCGSPFTYGVYTRVSAFHSWILNYIHPAFAAWSERQAVRGLRLDPDDDGWSNFEEFSFDSDPKDQGSVPVVSVHLSTDQSTAERTLQLDFSAPLPSDSVTYQLRVSEDLSTWRTASPSGIQATALAGTSFSYVQSLSILLPADQAVGRFYQVIPELGTSTQSFPAHLTLGETVSASLLETFRENAPLSLLIPGNRVRHFRLQSDLEQGMIGLRVSSEEFLPGLDIRDPQTNQLLLSLHPDEPVQDVVLSVDASDRSSWLISVLSLDDREGDFEMATWRVPSEQITIGQTYSGRLIESDPLTNNPYGNQLQTDSFLLSGVASTQPVEIQATSQVMDIALVILDGKTGRIIAEDDDSGEGLNAALVLEPTMINQEWIIQVTTSGWHDLGRYKLEVSLHQGDPLDRTRLSGTLRPGDHVTGTIDPTDARFVDEFGEVLIADIYDLEGVDGGELLAIHLDSDDFDTYLQLVDAFTSQLIEYNDDSGLTSNSRIYYPVPSGGLEEPARVIVSGFERTDRGSYDLRVEQMSVPTPMTAPTQRISIGDAVVGILDPGDQTYFDAYTGIQPSDYYLLEIPKEGARVAISLKSTDFDPFLSVLDPEWGFHIVDNEDHLGPDALIEHTFAPTEENEGVLIEVSSVFAEDLGEYHLSIEQVAIESPTRSEWRILPLEAGAELRNGVIDNKDGLPGGMLGHLYQLQAPDAIARWTITLESARFDPWLGLSRLPEGEILLENDFFGHEAPTLITNRSRLDLFSVGAADPLLIWVSSFFANETGPYQLTAQAIHLPVIEQEGNLLGTLDRFSLKDPNLLIHDGIFFAQDYAFHAAESSVPWVVTMTADAFRPECYLMDPPSQEAVFWSLPDEKNPHQASFRFTAEPGHSYVIRATTVDEGQTGEFTLSARKDIPSDAQNQ